MNTTKWIGTQGELLVSNDLIKKGYYVFSESGDNAPLDLIAIHNTDLCNIKRIQVKTASIKNGRIAIYGDNNTRSYHRVYSKDDFDYFGVYVYERDLIFYVPIESVIRDGKYRLIVRIDPPKNKQVTKINMYTEFKDVL